MRTVVWFRGKDLRLVDHAPLTSALAAGEVIPLFVVDPYFFAKKRAALLPHRIQYLVEALAELDAAIAERGSRLVYVEGKSVEVLPRIVERWRVDKVVAHRWVEPIGRERDGRIAAALGAKFELFEGETLIPPGTLRTAAGNPYEVFSQFARVARKTPISVGTLPAPKRMPPVPSDLEGENRAAAPSLKALGITRNEAMLPAGRRAAEARLANFVAKGLSHYEERRDRLDLSGTSRLSADLKFGVLSTREVYARVSSRPGASRYVDELLWREFAYSTLWTRPEVLEKPFRASFEGFPWVEGGEGFDAWAAGRTGYPIVDAAARQLLTEGFVHNRARMIAASFLTKHLLVHYRFGEQHYLRYLADGDWAQNNLGWQWSAGCGCDAQPYFRVFNPTLQGEKFDPEGAYVRRYLPELAELPTEHIHRPWEAPPLLLGAAGVTLGKTYPVPIVDLTIGRERFLAAAARHRGTHH